jgi:amidase
MEVGESALADALLVNERCRAFAYLDDAAAIRTRAEKSAGPFRGVPTAFKDLHAYDQMPMAAGRLDSQAIRPDVTEFALESLLAAGWNPIGKTAVPELGYPYWTDSNPAGPTVNPFDITLSAGGSSGGAAAACAAGVVAMAHASDGGGSIRIPAALCGVFGFKPSRGRVSQLPSATSSTGFATHGVISRQVIDAAYAMDCYPSAAGYEPFIAPHSLEGRYSQLAGENPGCMTLAVNRANMFHAEVDDDVSDDLELVVEELVKLGHRVVEGPVLFDDVFREQMLTVHKVGLRGSLAARRNIASPLSDVSVALSDWAAPVDADTYVKALHGLRETSLRVAEYMGDVDVLISPVLTKRLVPIDLFTKSSPSDAIDTMFQVAPYSAPYNVTGQPSASVPIFGAKPPAASVMLSGRIHEDARLLALCLQLENHFDWRQSFPPLWSVLYDD